MKNIEIFKRVEQKYILSEDEYKKLLSMVINHLEKDLYFKSKICNIYFDNNNYDLIINSLEKSDYKEKVRLRSYNIPSLNDNVFLEIKSKLEGVVYKRRVTLKLKDFYNYINNSNVTSSNKQIMSEIEYLVNRYNLVPKYFIGYDRTSYYDKDNINFRITFDHNIRSRKYDLNLEKGDYGIPYFKDKMYIMELKTNGALPLWFINVLSKLKIYPSSFSKYGSIYQKRLKEELVYV